MRAASAGLVAALAVAGCGHSEAKPAHASSADPWRVAATTGPLETIGDTAPTITLLASGAAPRRVLAYAPRGGVRHPALTFSIGVNGAPPEAVTQVHLTLRWEPPRAIGAPWEVAVDKVDAPTVDAGSDEQAVIDGIWAALGAFRGRIEIDRQHLRLARTAGPASTPSLLDVLYSVIVPLPETPLGVGARWEVRQTLRETNGDAMVDRVFELIAMNGDRLGVHVTGTAHWTTRGGSGEASMDESLDGTLAVELDDILPRTADVTRTLTLHLAPATAGQTPAAAGTLHIEIEPGSLSGSGSAW